MLDHHRGERPMSKHLLKGKPESHGFTVVDDPGDERS